MELIQREQDFSKGAVNRPSGRYQALVKPLVSAVLFSLALWGIHHLLAEIHYADLVAEIRGLTPGRLTLAVLFTAGSFAALVGYDWSALRYLGKRLPFPAVALASFCGYAVSNTVGLSVLSGGSVRYRMYVEHGLDGVDIARLSLFSILALGVGVHLVAAAALLIHPEIVANYFSLRPEILRLQRSLSLQGWSSSPSCAVILSR
jgi:phosphatidylglycerol lysyltransferase